MSVRENAYRLCKRIWSSPNYDRIYDLMMSLVTVSKEDMDSERDRSWYGYFEQSFGVQFLSYLLIDAQVPDVKNKLSVPLPSLPQEELDVLRASHKALLDLDRRCIARLISALPMAARAVDAYNKYPLPVPSGMHTLSVLPDDAAKDLITAFNNHPALELAIETKEWIAGLTPEQYVSAVLQMETTLSKLGTRKTPDDIVQVIIREDANSPARLVTRHMISIISLRSSLSMLNQMIFQSFLSKKLTVLDIDNVIDIQSHSNMIAVGHSVIYQQSNKAGFARYGELVLLLGVAPTDHDNGLCVVEGSTLHYSQDTGTTVDVELRVLDQHLNIFPKLLEGCLTWVGRRT